MEDAVTFPSSSRVKRPRNPDRLVASPEVLTRLNEWLLFLEHKLKGISLTRNQLMNWIIMNRPHVLSNQEIKQIEEKFFNEVRFAEWALKELRAAQGRGEAIRLSDIVARKFSFEPKNSTIQTKRKQFQEFSLKATQNKASTTHTDIENHHLSPGKSEVK